MSYETVNEKCKEILERDNNRCQYPACKSQKLQIAHRIAKGKVGKNWVRNYIFMNYGAYMTLADVFKEFINAPENVVTSCSTHNSSFNCLNKPVQAKKIIDSICERKGMRKIKKS